MISYAFKRTKYLSTIIVTCLIKTKMHRIINKLPIRIENESRALRQDKRGK